MNNRLKINVLVGIIGLITIINCNNSQTQCKDAYIVVEIDYGHHEKIESKKVQWSEGISALEALQHSADVVTHPVSQFVFVTSINNVNAKKGITAWYYELNSKPAKVLAIDNILKQGDFVRWVFKKDVCSKLIDGE